MAGAPKGGPPRGHQAQPDASSAFALIGHEHVLQQLRQVWRGGAEGGPRTLLFAGPEGVGRRPAARWLAAYVNCHALEEHRPCGVCESCVAVANGVSLDVREIAPATTTKSGRSKHAREITIDQLVPREGGDEEPLGTWLRSRPQHRARVGIIDHAETMTVPAANAFLKTLEEPPPGALIVLIAPGPDAVLPTVASRSTVVRFGAVPLSGFEDLGAHPGVRLGQPGALLRARASADESARARDCAESFLAALRGDLAEAVAAAGELSAGIDSALDAGVEPGPLGWLREPLRALPAPAYAIALEEVERCEDALAAYAQGALACTVLALRLRAVLGVAG